MEELSFKDIQLICKDCGKPFIFSANDQKFFAKQGYTNVPARCKTCREEFQNKKYKGQEVFNIKCSECGKVGKLTVKPTHPKQTLCGECFDQLFEKEKLNVKTFPTTLQEAFDQIKKTK